jgi:hypothetical protein
LVRRGAGAGETDRVTLTWPDNAIRNAWLRVTLKANGNSGLAADDVFTFGHLAGETGDAATPLRVSSLDLVAVRRAISAGGPLTTLTARYDLNRDGVLNALDVATVRGNLFHTLPDLTLTDSR